MWTLRFWKDAAERALTTAAESALAVLGVGAINVMTVDWTGVFGVAAGGAVLSILKSMAAARQRRSESASLARLDR